MNFIENLTLDFFELHENADRPVKCIGCGPPSAKNLCRLLKFKISERLLVAFYWEKIFEKKSTTKLAIHLLNYSSELVCY